ncbi:MAG TPA: hypothetical protein VEO93_02320 [Gemmatimonadales bacterium]|nr:hypothetical protein [Gemmatimonadales bacterium]
MSVGKEYLRRIHEALAEFEEAIKQHANPGVLGTSVAGQQTVDRARQKVVEVVVDIVTTDRMNK